MIIMDLTKKLLVLLAVFCLIASAGAVCAADNVTGDVDPQDISGVAGSQYQDEAGVGNHNDFDIDGDDSHPTAPEIDPDYAHHEPGSTNATGNSTAHAAGEPTNTTGNTTAAHTMHATGNPILLLLGVSAVLGGCGVALRRK